MITTPDDPMMRYPKLIAVRFLFSCSLNVVGLLISVTLVIISLYGISILLRVMSSSSLSKITLSVAGRGFPMPYSSNFSARSAFLVPKSVVRAVSLSLNLVSSHAASSSFWRAMTCP